MARHVSFVVDAKDLEELFRGHARSVNNQLEFDDYSVSDPLDYTNAESIQSNVRILTNRVPVLSAIAAAVQAYGSIGKYEPVWKCSRG